MVNMTVRKGQTLLINGDKYTVAKLFQSGRLITTTGEEFDLGFDMVEEITKSNYPKEV